MKTITQMYETALETKKRKGWDRIYIIVDLHETVLLPTWSVDRSNVFYPNARRCLRLLSTMKEVVLILWSSSSVSNNVEYQRFFQKEGVDFKYINSNPEVESTEYADFDTKLYMNMIIDDKGGFEPERDWEELYYTIKL